MKLPAISRNVEPQILRAGRQVEDTFHKYLGRDAILPEVKKIAEKPVEAQYFSPTSLITDAAKESTQGQIIDFIF